MAPSPPAHHHRSTTKTPNKAFKTRHASKSELKDRAKGKVERVEKGVRRTLHQQIMSKLDRRNHAKQHRINKQVDRDEKGGVFAGRDGAPRIVTVVPLTEDVRSEDVVKSLSSSVDVGEEVLQAVYARRVDVPRFKQRVQYLTPSRDLLACLDACRLSDFVLFVLSAEAEVDQLGEQMLRCIESQGVSTVLTGVHNLNVVEPAKKRPDILKSLKSYITHFFAMQEKVHDLSSRQECSNVMRSLCTTMPKGIKWREDRSWMVVDDVRWQDGEAAVTGVVRGRGLKADRLVQVGDWGDFLVEKITAAPYTTGPERANPSDMVGDFVDGEQVLQQPGDDQDDLAELAPEEVIMDDDMSMLEPSLAPSDRKHVLLDDHQYFDDEQDDEPAAPRRLPRGTSRYQATWYLNDVSDSGSDLEDVEVDDDGDLTMNGSVVAGPADGHFEEVMADPTEAGAPSEYPQSEAFLDQRPEEEAEQIAAYRKQRRDDAEDDREFPDQIELHPGVSARERLARYRGLKSLRTSPWDTAEDKLHEPEDWNRLLEIADYKSAKHRVLKEGLQGGVKPGTRVNVHLRVASEQRVHLQSLPQPTALFSLLKHEHKRTVVNTSINLSSDYGAPLKSKETLILQCGPRRLAINPLFSQAGNTPNNVHKFDRYLHPGRTAVASFLGPVIWGSVPCLYFKQTLPAADSDAVEDLANSLGNGHKSANANLQLIATGTVLQHSTSRIIAKRIILTGHPYKIHKKLVTVRYMFFSSEDVEYFRALQLWTKRGRSGFIKEPLGIHGYFKATFDGKINPLDAVAVSLYKRVWPRQAKWWRSGTSDPAEAEDGEAPMLLDSAQG